MKRLIIIVLFTLLLLDLSLCYLIYTTQRRHAATNEQISVTGESRFGHPYLVNRDYLEKKLSERRFWDLQRVNLFKSSIRKTTVKKLRFIISHTPQPIPIQVQEENKRLVVLMSYTQQYDKPSQTMTITVHEDRQRNAKYSREYMYTGVILYSVFDLTYDRPRDMRKFDKQLKEFLKDFYSAPDKRVVVAFSLI